MFIWGEEVEYLNRAKKHGFSILTVANAVHYHPKNRMVIDKIFNAQVAWQDNPLRDYCFIINLNIIC